MAFREFNFSPPYKDLRGTQKMHIICTWIENLSISFLDKMNLSHDKNSDNLTGKEVSEKNNHGIFTGYYTTLITN